VTSTLSVTCARDREPWADWLAEIYRGINAVS